MVRQGVICAGCWALDRIKVIDAWPAEEELANIIGLDKQGGGSAYNVAIDLRKLDPTIPVAGIGLLGRDVDGDFLLEQARQCGINVAQMHRSDAAATAFTDVISVASTGKRTFFHHAGTNDVITPDHFDFSQTPAKILHLGLLGVHAVLDQPWKEDPNGWVSVLKKAKAAGMHTNIELVSIAAQRNRQLALPCLPYLDTLIINDHEAGSLASIDTLVHGVANPRACRKAAKLLIDMGSMHTVIVHYPQGSVCVTRDGGVQEFASQQVAESEIQSTVGAGDAFTAGVLYAMHQSWPLDKAVQLGHAVAAASLRCITTTGSVGSVSQCLALLVPAPSN